MNDPTYVEAARKLAERILREGGTTNDERITFAFRLATARRPSERELSVLRALLEQQLDAYRNDEKAAAELLVVGESARDNALNAPHHAAWTLVANLVLNLDEALNK